MKFGFWLMFGIISLILLSVYVSASYVVNYVEYDKQNNRFVYADSKEPITVFTEITHNIKIPSIWEGANK